jgi:hypothetical protein
MLFGTQKNKGKKSSDYDSWIDALPQTMFPRPIRNLGKPPRCVSTTDT